MILFVGHKDFGFSRVQVVAGGQILRRVLEGVRRVSRGAFSAIFGC